MLQLQTPAVVSLVRCYTLSQKRHLLLRTVTNNAIYCAFIDILMIYIKYLTMHEVQMHTYALRNLLGSCMVCTSVREIIHNCAPVREIIHNCAPVREIILELKLREINHDCAYAREIINDCAPVREIIHELQLREIINDCAPVREIIHELQLREIIDHYASVREIIHELIISRTDAQTIQ